MEVKIYLDLDKGGEIGTELKDRTRRGQLGCSDTAVAHRGVQYYIDEIGVYFVIDSYVHEVPGPYRDIVSRVVIECLLPSGSLAPIGVYSRRSGTRATVESYTGTQGAIRFVIMVEARTLGRANRLLNDIRSGRATAARRVDWDGRKVARPA